MTETDPTLRLANDSDRERLRQLFSDMAVRVDVDYANGNPPQTSVLLNLAEVETLLAWAEHVETYSLGYTGGLIPRLQLALIRLKDGPTA